MPYSPKATRFFRAREHGFVPDDPKLRKLNPTKAGELLDEAKARKEGQKRAIKRSMA